ncbi:hypothetical protein T4E_2290 [Trichinella pseudospiralis]|uniref:F-box domain-containing protein n=1 Tax=Trichinella pseudospiralis TaxID=6337 RepID=A0A0V0YJJ5_TRIPS|nr:hypothetical protein T4E_2290 [Trichinella pseudospiralis]
MQALPTEVLLNIFEKLQLPDRLSCSLVCRRWFGLLHRELCSLTSLELVLTAAGFGKLFNKIGTKQHDIVYVNVTGIGLDGRLLRFWILRSLKEDHNAAAQSQSDSEMADEDFVEITETRMGTGHPACYLRKCTSPRKTLLLYSN